MHRTKLRPIRVGSVAARAKASVAYAAGYLVVRLPCHKGSADRIPAMRPFSKKWLPSTDEHYQCNKHVL